MDEALKMLKTEMAQLVFLNIKLMETMMEMENCIEHIKQDRLEIMLDDYKTNLFDEKVDRLAGKDSLSRKDSGISSISDDERSSRGLIGRGLSNRNYPRDLCSFDNTTDLGQVVKDFACYSCVDKTTGYTVGLAGDAKEAESMVTYLPLQTKVESGDRFRANVDNANVDTKATGLNFNMQKTVDISNVFASVDQRPESHEMVNTNELSNENRNVDISVDNWSTFPNLSLNVDSVQLTCVDKAENPAANTGGDTDSGIHIGVDTNVDTEAQQAANSFVDYRSKQHSQRLVKSVRQPRSNLDKVANAAAITDVDAGVDKETRPATNINVDCRAKLTLNRIRKLAKEPGPTSDNAANSATITNVDTSVDKEARPATNLNFDSKAAHRINGIARSVRLHCFKKDKVVITTADKCVDMDSKWTMKKIVDSGPQKHINRLEKSADRNGEDKVAISVAENNLELYEKETKETKLTGSPVSVDNKEISKAKEGQACSMSFFMGGNLNERQTTDSSSSTNSVSSSVRSYSSGVVSVGDDEDMFFDSNVEKEGSFTDSAIDIDFDLPHRFSFMMAATSDL